MKKVNICFLTDDGYAMPTCVAMTSMLINKNKDSTYNIFMLCINVSEENISRFKQLEKNDFRIKIIELNDEYKKYNMEGVSASATAMYKFHIPQILKEIDKVIYLDGDIIVNSDLYELYSIDLSNKYVGVVKDICGAIKRHYRSFIKNKIFYFNSGVMLMNLKEMRTNNITEKLIDYRINGYNELMDQDALNYVLKDNKLELPFKYNTQTMCTFINKNVSQLKKLTKINDGCEDYDSVAIKSIILHYSLKNKPWKSQTGFMFDLWMYYYYKSPFNNEKMIRKNTNTNKKNNVLSKYQALKKNIRRYNFFKKFGIK